MGRGGSDKNYFLNISSVKKLEADKIMNQIQGDIIDLWPTKILQRYLKNFEKPNSLLLKLLNEMNKENKNISTDYRENNLLNLDHPGTNWLRDSVNDAVIDYLKSASIDYSVDWQIHSWANINRLGDYHDPHNHPHSYLSGAYYLKVPSSIEIGSREDTRPNCISLYDPRPGINMGSIKKDPYIDPEFTIMPRPGLLMLWPAFINHFVHPNFSRKTRVSLSFNIILKWSDNYLPIQSY